MLTVSRSFLFFHGHSTVPGRESVARANTRFSVRGTGPSAAFGCLSVTARALAAVFRLRVARISKTRRIVATALNRGAQAP
jgi:hypothetical protein